MHRGALAARLAASQGELGAHSGLGQAKGGSVTLGLVVARVDPSQKLEIARALQARVPGVVTASVNLATGEARVRFSPEQTGLAEQPDEPALVVQAGGVGAEEHGTTSRPRITTGRPVCSTARHPPTEVSLSPRNGLSQHATLSNNH